MGTETYRDYPDYDSPEYLAQQRELSIVGNEKELSHVSDKAARRKMAELLTDAFYPNRYVGHTAKHEKAYRPYPYITLYKEQFQQLVAPYLKPGQSFVDVGCGGGDKLWFARKVQPELASITGIELSKGYAKIAKEICPFAAIKNVNALRHDYKHYDVIYMYHPIQDGKLQLKLEQRVAETMKRGALLISTMGSALFHSDPKKYIKWVVFQSERYPRCWGCSPKGSRVLGPRKKNCLHDIYATHYRKP
jgi:2-polyprenyl-3-methyl-5-hydroxy-6-metoxy-1,4-benzoquinol methylase